MNKSMQNKLDKLEKQFPNVWFKDGEEFADGYENTIWTGEGSTIGEYDYAFSSYSYYETFGVHPILAKALDKLGLYAEFYDAGTVFIYKK